MGYEYVWTIYVYMYVSIEHLVKIIVVWGHVSAFKRVLQFLQ